MTTINKAATIIPFPRTTDHHKTGSARTMDNRSDPLLRLGFMPELSRIETAGSVTCFNLTFSHQDFNLKLAGAVDWRQQIVEFDAEFTSLTIGPDNTRISRMSISFRYERSDLTVAVPDDRRQETDILGSFQRLVSAVGNAARRPGERKRIIMTLADQEACKILSAHGPQASRDLMSLVLFTVWLNEVNNRDRPVTVYNINVSGNSGADRRSALARWSTSSFSVEVQRFEAVIDPPATAL